MQGAGDSDPIREPAALGPRHVVLIFVDGLGWGGPDPAVNPCLAFGGEILRFGGVDGAAGVEPVQVDPGGWVRAIDAVLGVPGLPQSATGQTTLLTGVNAQGVLGRHLTGFPSVPLRELLLEFSVLKTLTDRGYAATFLNAFRPRFFDLPRAARLRLSATTVANLAGELPFHDLQAVRERRCLYQEFTNHALRERGFEVPLFTPAEAGRILARQVRRHDFVLFEYFQTDRAGHSQDAAWACKELRKLEEFLSCLLAELGLARRQGAGRGDPEGEDDRGSILVVLTSDHGNLEDLSTKRHTLNRVPLMAWGKQAFELVVEVENLAGVTPALLRRFERSRPARVESAEPAAE